MKGADNAPGLVAARPPSGIPTLVGSALVVAAASAWQFYLQAFPSTWGVFGTDLRQHLRLAHLLWEGKAYIPHPGFHFATIGLSKVSGISPPLAAVVLLTAAEVASFGITFKILSFHLASRLTRWVLVALAFSLTFVSAVYDPYFSSFIYMGQGTPNIWHSPTWIVAEPFVLWSFFETECILREGLNSQRSALRLSFALLMSTILKPSFSVVYLPVLGILFAWKFATKRCSLRLLASIGAVVAPTVALLAIQYLARYGAAPEDGGKVIVWAPLKVWSIKSSNIAFSAALGLAFPIGVAICWPRQLLENEALRFAWLVTLVGFLERALLAESGAWMTDGNWAWGYFFALKLIFVYSAVSLFATYRCTSSLGNLRTAIPLLLLLLHFVSGSIYFWQMLSGGGYR